MNKKLFLVPVAIILAVAAGLAGKCMHKEPGPVLDAMAVGCKHMAKQLNLTDAQQSEINTIMQSERAKMQPLTQQLRQNEQAQNAAISGDFNETEARAFAQKQTQIMNDLIVEKQRVKSQIMPCSLLNSARKRSSSCNNVSSANRNACKRSHNSKEPHQQSSLSLSSFFPPEETGRPRWLPGIFGFTLLSLRSKTA